MKKPNITLGPWKIEQLATPPIFERGTLAIQPDIACLQVPELDTCAASNAKAIAALPKLLEALENAMPILFHMANNQRRTEIDIQQAEIAFNSAKQALLAAGYTE